MVSEALMDIATEMAKKALDEAERLFIKRFGLAAQPDQIIPLASIIAQTYNSLLTNRCMSSIGS
jgi:hypothetical protein